MEVEMSKDIKCIPITNKKQIAEWKAIVESVQE